VAFEHATEIAPAALGQDRRAAALYALLCVAVAFAWQLLTVHYNYGGNWSALFQTGSNWTLPPGPTFEGTYRYQNTLGFDGQFYRYIAHDPFFTRNFLQYVDLPRFRWPRILVPGLAFILALGQPAWIDASYSAVILVFLFFGAYWLSRYALRHGRHAAWGLLFALIPAATIAVERLTVDIALAALCVGFGFHASEKRSRLLYLILALAPLTRETGLILPGACFLASSLRGQWRKAAASAATILPCLLWLVYVRAHTAPTPIDWGRYFVPYPLGGILRFTLDPRLPAEASTWKEAIAGPLDYLALLGVWLALFFSARWLWRRQWGPVEFAVGGFLLLTLLLAHFPTWGEAYSFGRYLSPLLVWLAMHALAQRRAGPLVPLGLVALRVLAQLTPQTIGILAGLLGVETPLPF
jgi:hypothetical protein